MFSIQIPIHEDTPWTEIPFEPIPLELVFIPTAFVFLGFLFGFVTVMFAPESENPNGCAYWFFLGLMLGPIGVLIAVIADKLKK